MNVLHARDARDARVNVRAVAEYHDYVESERTRARVVGVGAQRARSSLNLNSTRVHLEWSLLL